MASYHGRFVWYELITSDPGAAGHFYGAVAGWQARDAGMAGLDYTILSATGIDLGGLMPIPPEAAGAAPGWIGYIAVEDVDGMAGRLADTGGQVHHGPADIPGVGRFALVADPHGAVFALFQGMADEMPPQAQPGTPGHAAWRELYAGDLDQAFDFYAGLFGWTRAEAIDMGPMGVYQLFAAGGETIGGMMTRPPEVPPSWTFYFACDGIDAALDRVTANGGTLLHGPQQVPGDAWIIQCRDPQGAAFAMVGPRG